MSNPTVQHEIRWVTLGELEVIYREAQRDVNQRMVRKIVENFDPDAFGLPFVAQVNGRGRYHIIDGQHRITALKHMGWGDGTEIQVEVKQIKNKADVEAARLFISRNTSQAPSAVDRFIANVTAGSLDHVAANAIVHEAGFWVGPSPSVNVISAANALLKSYRQYGDDALLSALTAISATWRADGERTRGEIIEAWSWLFGDHREVVDPKRLVSRIGKKYTAGTLIGAGRANRDVLRGKLVTNVLRVTVVEYNVGLRTNARIELDL